LCKKCTVCGSTRYQESNWCVICCHDNRLSRSLSGITSGTEPSYKSPIHKSKRPIDDPTRLVANQTLSTELFGLTSLKRAAVNGDECESLRLISLGSDVNDTSGSWTALMAASAFGHLDVVELLCMHGADPNIVNNCGATALWLAMEANRADIVRIMCNYGADPDHHYSSYTPLNLAATRGFLDVVIALVENKACIDTPLCQDSCRRESKKVSLR
jgi:ankyrin repeat protein